MAESADHEQAVSPEWSYLITTEDIAQGQSYSFQIEANKDERKNLARRLNIISLDKLSADLDVRRENSRVIYVSGNLQAKISQECISTLEPIVSEINDQFEAWYADPDQAVSFARARHEKQKGQSEDDAPMLEEQDDPEPIIDGQINLGELVAQYLSLSINPYPQSIDSDELLEVESISSPRGLHNPFAKLKELKDKTSN